MITECIATCWKNTKGMPFILRSLVQGAMVVAPIFLLLLVFPLIEWEINGHLVSHASLWSSSEGVAIASTLALAAAGGWGLAARNSRSRWLLVSLPIVPYIVLALFPGTFSDPVDFADIASAVLTAAVFYCCLFRLRVVRAYLGADGVGT